MQNPKNFNYENNKQSTVYFAETLYLNVSSSVKWKFNSSMILSNAGDRHQSYNHQAGVPQELVHIQLHDDQIDFC